MEEANNLNISRSKRWQWCGALVLNSHHEKMEVKATWMGVKVITMNKNAIRK